MGGWGKRGRRQLGLGAITIRKERREVAAFFNRRRGERKRFEEKEGVRTLAPGKERKA